VDQRGRRRKNRLWRRNHPNGENPYKLMNSSRGSAAGATEFEGISESKPSAVRPNKAGSKRGGRTSEFWPVQRRYSLRMPISTQSLSRNLAALSAMWGREKAGLARKDRIQYYRSRSQHRGNVPSRRIPSADEWTGCQGSIPVYTHYLHLCPWTPLHSLSRAHGRSGLLESFSPR